MARLALVVTGGRDAHKVARASKVLIGFGAALEDARLAASGAQGQEIGGAEKEHFLQGLASRAGTALGGDGVLPVPQPLKLI